MHKIICSKNIRLAVGLSCAVALATHTQLAAAQTAQPAQPQQPRPAQQPQQPAQQQPQPAQQQPQPAQQQPQPAQQPAQNDAPDIDEKPAQVPDSNIVVQPHMRPDERPQPPRSEAVDTLGDQTTTPVATGAGVGSDIAYASRGIVELGGTLALTHQSQTTIFRLAPSVGYFIVDNLELTLFPELLVTNVDGDGDDDDQTDVSVGGTIEPSYHVPFTDRLLGFAGLGLGVRYADDPGVDVFLRPRLGMDVMVGRSGILKPAAFLDIGVNDGLTSGGIEVGFTVML
jgi:hypothetical protein